MLQKKKKKQIPERLSHYTNLEALKSILSDQDGKGILRVLWKFRRFPHLDFLKRLCTKGWS